MSVIVSRRKESRLEVITHAVELHKMLTELAQRNFGIKNRETLEANAFLIQNFKSRIDNTAALMSGKLRAANSRYPTTLHEYEIRRDCQTDALVCCEELIRELQQIIGVFASEMDINPYARYIQAINREIGLIKKWRQSDNKIRVGIQNKG